MAGYALTLKVKGSNAFIRDMTAATKATKTFGSTLQNAGRNIRSFSTALERMSAALAKFNTRSMTAKTSGISKSLSELARASKLITARDAARFVRVMKLYGDGIATLTKTFKGVVSVGSQVTALRKVITGLGKIDFNVLRVRPSVLRKLESFRAAIRLISRTFKDVEAVTVTARTLSISAESITHLSSVFTSLISAIVAVSVKFTQRDIKYARAVFRGVSQSYKEFFDLAKRISTMNVTNVAAQLKPLRTMFQDIADIFITNDNVLSRLKPKKLLASPEVLFAMGEFFHKFTRAIHFIIASMPTDISVEDIKRKMKAFSIAMDAIIGKKSIFGSSGLIKSIRRLRAVRDVGDLGNVKRFVDSITAIYTYLLTKPFDVQQTKRLGVFAVARLSPDMEEQLKGLLRVGYVLAKLVKKFRKVGDMSNLDGLVKFIRSLSTFIRVMDRSRQVLASYVNANAGQNILQRTFLRRASAFDKFMGSMTKALTRMVSKLGKLRGVKIEQLTAVASMVQAIATLLRALHKSFSVISVTAKQTSEVRLGRSVVTLGRDLEEFTKFITKFIKSMYKVGSAIGESNLPKLEVLTRLIRSMSSVMNSTARLRTTKGKMDFIEGFNAFIDSIHAAIKKLAKLQVSEREERTIRSISRMMKAYSKIASVSGGKPVGTAFSNMIRPMSRFQQFFARFSLSFGRYGKILMLAWVGIRKVFDSMWRVVHLAIKPLRLIGSLIREAFDGAVSAIQVSFRMLGSALKAGVSLLAAPLRSVFSVRFSDTIKNAINKMPFSGLARTFWSKFTAAFVAGVKAVGFVGKVGLALSNVLRNVFKSVRDKAQQYARTLTTAIQRGMSTGRNMVMYGGIMTYLQKDTFRNIVDFDYLLKQIQVLGGVAEQEMGTVRDRLLDLGKAGGFTAVQLGQAMLELTKSGLSGAEAIAMLPDAMNLAIAGDLELADATQFVIQALSAYRKSTKEAAVVTDSFVAAANVSVANVGDLAQAFSYAAPSAYALGIEIDQLNAMLAMLADRGLESGRSGRALRIMFQKLSNPTEQARKDIEAYGLALFDAQGNFRNIGDIMQDMIKIMSRMTEEQQFAFLKTVGGSENSVQALRLLLETTQNGTLVWQDYARKMQEATSAADVAKTIFDTFKGSLNKLKGAAMSLVTRAIQPLLDKIGKPFINALIDIINALSGLNPELLTLVTTVGLLIPALTTLTGVVLWFGSMALMPLVGLFQTLAMSMNFLLNPMQIVAGITTIGGAFGLMGSSVLLVAPALVTIGGVLYTFYDAVKGNEGTLKSGLIDTGKEIIALWSPIKNIFIGIGDVLASLLKGVGGEKFSSIFSFADVRRKLTQLRYALYGVSQIFDFIKAVGTESARALELRFDHLYKFVKDNPIFEALLGKGFTKNDLSVFITTVLDQFDAFKYYVSKIVKSIRELFSNIIDGKSVQKQLSDLKKNFMGAMAALLSAFSKFTGLNLDWLVKPLQSGSVNRVMSSVGLTIAKYLYKGFKFAMLNILSPSFTGVVSTLFGSSKFGKMLNKALTVGLQKVLDVGDVLIKAFRTGDFGPVFDSLKALFDDLTAYIESLDWTPIADEIIGALENAIEYAVKGVAGFGYVLARIGGALFSSGAVKAFGTAILQSLRKGFAAAISAKNTIGAWLDENRAKLLSGVTEFVRSIPDIIEQAAISLSDLLHISLNTTKLRDKLRPQFDKAAEIIGGLVNDLIDLISGKKNISDFEWISTVADNIADFIDTVAPVIGRLAQEDWDMLILLLDNAKKMISAINKYAIIQQTVADGPGSGGTAQRAKENVKSFGEVMGTIVNTVLELANLPIQGGLAVINGLFESITRLFDLLGQRKLGMDVSWADVISGAFDGLINGIQEAASKSQVLQDAAVWVYRAWWSIIGKIQLKLGDLSIWWSKVLRDIVNATPDWMLPGSKEETLAGLDRQIKLWEEGGRFEAGSRANFEYAWQLAMDVGEQTLRDQMSGVGKFADTLEEAMMGFTGEAYRQAVDAWGRDFASAEGGKFPRVAAQFINGWINEQLTSSDIAYSLGVSQNAVETYKGIFATTFEQWVSKITSGDVLPTENEFKMLIDTAMSLQEHPEYQQYFSEALITQLESITKIDINQDQIIGLYENAALYAHDQIGQIVDQYTDVVQDDMTSALERRLQDTGIVVVPNTTVKVVVGWEKVTIEQDAQDTIDFPNPADMVLQIQNPSLGWTRDFYALYETAMENALATGNVNYGATDIATSAFFTRPIIEDMSRADALIQEMGDDLISQTQAVFSRLMGEMTISPDEFGIFTDMAQVLAEFPEPPSDEYRDLAASLELLTGVDISWVDPFKELVDVKPGDTIAITQQQADELFWTLSTADLGVLEEVPTAMDDMSTASQLATDNITDNIKALLIRYDDHSRATNRMGKQTSSAWSKVSSAAARAKNDVVSAMSLMYQRTSTLTDKMITKLNQLRLAFSSLVNPQALTYTPVGTYTGPEVAYPTFGGKRAKGGPVMAGRLYEVAENGIGELLRVGGHTYLIPGQHGEVIPPASATNMGTPQSYGDLGYSIGRRLEAMVANIDKNIGAIYELLKSCCKELKAKFSEIVQQLQEGLSATSNMGGGIGGGTAADGAPGGSGSLSGVQTAVQNVVNTQQTATKVSGASTSGTYVSAYVEPPLPSSVPGYTKYYNQKSGAYEPRKKTFRYSFSRKNWAGMRAQGGQVLPGRMYEVAENNLGELLRIGKRTFLIPGAAGQIIPPLSASEQDVPRSYGELGYNIGRRLEAMVANIDKNIGEILQILRDCCEKFTKFIDEYTKSVRETTNEIGSNGAVGGGIGGVGGGIGGAVGGGIGGIGGVSSGSENATINRKPLTLTGGTSLVEPPIPTNYGWAKYFDTRQGAYRPVRNSAYRGLYRYREFGGMRASGGDVMSGTLYRVGEKLPELLRTVTGKQYLIPSERGNIAPMTPMSQQTPPPVMNTSHTNITVRGGDVYININGSDANPQEIADAVKRELGDYLSLSDRRIETTLSGAGRV